MTITSNNNQLLKMYEPNAACFEERLECLKYLYENGFRTSVMCEPYLSDPGTFIDKCLSYITDTFIIGEMNYNGELDPYFKYIYSNDYMIALYNIYKDQPKVFFKKGMYDMILKIYSSKK